MAETRPAEVIEALTWGEDAKFVACDGPWEFGPERAVVYVREDAAFTDVLRVEVTVHSRGAVREAAELDRRRRLEAAEANAREWERLEPLVGKAVWFREERAFLARVAKGDQPWDPLTVECVLVSAGAEAGPVRGVPADVETPDG